MPPRCCVGALSQGAQSTESLVLPGRRSDALEPVDLSFQRLRKFGTRTAVPPRQHDVGHTSRRVTVATTAYAASRRPSSSGCSVMRWSVRRVLFKIDRPSSDNPRGATPDERHVWWRTVASLVYGDYAGLLRRPTWPISHASWREGDSRHARVLRKPMLTAGTCVGCKPSLDNPKKPGTHTIRVRAKRPSARQSKASQGTVIEKPP
jgi:hypothetical protein